MGVIARLDPAHFSSIRQVVLVSDWERLRKHEGPATSAALRGVLDRLAGRLVGRGVFRAEKIEAGMKETVARGRWPWKAPIGYRNDRSPDGRKIVVPDEQARLVRKAFESVAAGEVPAAVLRRVTALGLTTKKGRPRCWLKECGAIQMRSEHLEEIFGELLRRVQLAPGMVRLVEAALLDLWQELRRGSVQEAAAVKRRIIELEQWKKRLVQAYIYDQAIDRATYDKELAGLEEALTFTNLELRDAAMEDFDMEASLGYARAVVTKTYQLWEAADPDQKRRLQKLIFPDGLSLVGEALGTPVTALIFGASDPEMTDLEGLVAHTGFEPVLPA